MRAEINKIFRLREYAAIADDLFADEIRICLSILVSVENGAYAAGCDGRQGSPIDKIQFPAETRNCSLLFWQIAHRTSIEIWLSTRSTCFRNHKYYIWRGSGSRKTLLIAHSDVLSLNNWRIGGASQQQYEAVFISGTAGACCRI